VSEQTQAPFGGSAVVGSFVASAEGVAEEARTRGFAAPVFAGCAFVEVWYALRYGPVPGPSSAGAAGPPGHGPDQLARRARSRPRPRVKRTLPTLSPAVLIVARQNRTLPPESGVRGRQKNSSDV
jgi:hypothetical protein